MRTISDAYLNLPWLHLRCGDLVYLNGDYRHVGMITAIFNSATAKVIWKESGWISYEPLAELAKVKL
jgi:hypothetical protein